MLTKLFAGLVALIGVFLTLSFIMSWPIMFLWNNCVVGVIDGTHPMTWLQAWGLMALIALIFSPNRVKIGNE